MTENWRPIPGYEGRYDISDRGNVRSWLPYRGQADRQRARRARQALRPAATTDTPGRKVAA